MNFVRGGDRNHQLPFSGKTFAKIGQNEAPIRYALLVALITMILWPVQARAEDPLDVYRKLLGSSLEKRILDYARACINHAFNPNLPAPGNVVKLKDLPRTGLYLTLMRGREVRACVGSFAHDASDMRTAIRKTAEEVIYADVRSRPLSLIEVEDLSIVLSFVGPLKEIQDPYAVDFTREGLYASQDNRGGVLLPGETRTLEFGLKRILRQHAFDPRAPIRYATFKVVVFDERRHR